MTHQQRQMIWLVVLVKSGIPVLAEAYSDQITASNREKRLREEINPDYDEVGLFEVEVDKPPEQEDQ